MSSPDVVQWKLEFSFKSKDHLNKVIKKLLELPFVIDFSYDTYFCDLLHKIRYRAIAEGHGSGNLALLTKFIKKADFCED